MGVNIIPGLDDMTSWGFNDYANGAWGGSYVNERPCIDGHRGIKGGGEHKSRGDDMTSWGDK